MKNLFKKYLNATLAGVFLLNVCACAWANLRLENSRCKILRESYYHGGANNMVSAVPIHRRAAAITGQEAQGYATSSLNRVVFVGYLFPMYAGQTPQDFLINLVGKGRFDVELSWSNIVEVPFCDVYANTNLNYTYEPADWFVLSNQVASPFIHSSASNFPAAYYRLVNMNSTSAYDVGKFDINIPSGSVAWISFPFVPQSKGDTVNEWLAGRFEPRLFSEMDFPSIERQETVGVGYDRVEYYIDDWGTGDTNFFGTFPDSTNLVEGLMYIVSLPNDHPEVSAAAYGMVPTNDFSYEIPYKTVPWLGLVYPAKMSLVDSGITNLFYPPQLYSGADYDAIEQQLSPGEGYSRAEYYIDDWGTGETNFFFTQGSDENFKPGLGIYILFSTQREGTGVWNAIRSY